MTISLKTIGTKSPYAVYFADIYIGQIIKGNDKYVVDYPNGSSHQYIEQASAELLRLNASDLRATLINQIDSSISNWSK